MTRISRLRVVSGIVGISGVWALTTFTTSVITHSSPPIWYLVVTLTIVGLASSYLMTMIGRELDA